MKQKFKKGRRLLQRLNDYISLFSGIFFPRTSWSPLIIDFLNPLTLIMLKLLLWILRDYLTRLNSLVTIRTRASISLRSCNSVFGHPHYMPTRLQPRHQSTYIFLDLSIEQAFRLLLFATAAVFLLVAWLKLSNVFIRKIMSSMLSNFFNCVFSFRVIISRALIRQFFIRHIDLDNFTKHCILLMVIH